MTTVNLITRLGVLNKAGQKATNNQCGSVGAELYEYELKVLFSPDAKLDENGYLIDHVMLDAAVQKASLDSCEVMAKVILDQVEKTLNDSSVLFIGLKIKIRPTLRVEQQSAYFQQFRSYGEGNLALVMNL